MLQFVPDDPKEIRRYPDEPILYIFQVRVSLLWNNTHKCNFFILTGSRNPSGQDTMKHVNR